MAFHNVTVDDADTSGVIHYTNSFKSGWADQTCSTCYAKPIDLMQVFDGTWHDTTHMDGDTPLTAQFTFTGSAIYVFGIQVNSTSGIPIVNNSLVFTLDGQPAGTYDHTPNDPNYEYNVNFYKKENMKFGPHNLTMAVDRTSMVLFDYIVYTTNSTAPTSPPTSLPSAPSPNHAGAIAGGVVGGFAGLAVLIVLVWALFFRRRQRAGVTMLPESPGRKTSEELGHRPGFLSRFHPADGPPNVEPFTMQGAGVTYPSGKMAQRHDRDTAYLSGVGSSRVMPPSSFDPPTSLPPSSHGAVSSQGATSSGPPDSPDPVRTLSPTMTAHSPTPSQSVSNIGLSATASSATSADMQPGDHHLSESVANGKPERIVEEREEAPPAYGSAP